MEIQSTLDFSKFESLKAMARQKSGPSADGTQGTDPSQSDGQKKALRAAAEQFEALFLQEMLKSMRASWAKTSWSIQPPFKPMKKCLTARWHCKWLSAVL